MRAFIAIALPVQVERCIETLEQMLRAKPFPVRWVKPRNVHLTLKFLGEIEEGGVEAVATAMVRACAGVPPIALSMQGVGVFPGIKNPRVLWTGVGGQTDLLAQLHGRLDRALAETGFDAETRPFRAHLTLGRFKGRTAPADLARALQETGGFDAVPFEAGEIILFKSDLRPQGAVYSPLKRCLLGPPTA